MTPNLGRIVLCENEMIEDLVRAAGIKPASIVKREETVCRIENRRSILDHRFAGYSEYVLAYTREASDLRDRIAIRLGDEKCRWFNWPEQPESPKQIRNLIEAARPMWTDEVCLMSDIPERGPQKTYQSGFPMLDAHGFRLVRPAFMPIIGPYSSGKSVLARQLACNLYRLHGWKTLITAFEEQVKPRYIRDLRQHLIGSDGYDINGDIVWTPKHPNSFTPSDLAQADAKIEDGFRFLFRKRNSLLDLNRLIDRVEFAVRVYGVDVVIIDPVNEIDHRVPKGETKTDYLGRAFMQLKQLADDYSLLMILVAHPAKDGVEKRQQKSRIYTLNDAADTAHYGNKADIGWCVWRPAGLDDAPTYLNVDKLKDHEVMGQPTLAKLVLDKGLGRFNVVRTGYAEVLSEMLDD